MGKGIKNFLNKYSFYYGNVLSINVFFFTIIFYSIFQLLLASYIEGSAHLGYIIGFSYLIIMYLFILFHEIAFLKDINLSEGEYYEYSLLSLEELVQKAGSDKKKTAIYAHVFVAKITHISFLEYMKDHPLEDKGIFQFHMNVKSLVTLKKTILKLSKKEVLKFAEREKYYLSQALMYALEDNLKGDNDNMNDIKAENNLRIMQFKNNTFDTGLKPKYIFPKKDFKNLWNYEIKSGVYNLWLKNNEQLDDPLKVRFINHTIWLLAIEKYTEKQVNPIHAIFNFFIPFRFVLGDLFNRR